MLVRYFRRPSRIEQLRSSTGGHLLEGFAKELSQGRYQWVAARKHIRAAEHFLHWIAHRNLSITSVEERYAQQFLDHLKRCRCRGHHPPLKPHRQKYSVDLWFDYLRHVGIVPTPTFVEPWDELYVRLLDPKTGQLLREHVRQKRGWYRIKEEDRPKRTPLRTSQLLWRAGRAGSHIGALCDACGSSKRSTNN
jgi:hypothetical protein